MPEISRFFGIVVAMYYKDHGPPHFHAKYSGQTGVFSIEDLQLIEGRSIAEESHLLGFGMGT
jgi:hypothetical protein